MKCPGFCDARGSGGGLRGKEANAGGGGDADGLKDLSRATGGLRADPEALAVLLDVHVREAIEVSDHLGPLLVNARGFEPILQSLAKDQREIGTEHVAADRLVALVPDCLLYTSPSPRDS